MVIAVWELTAAVMVNFAQTFYIVNKNLCSEVELKILAYTLQSCLISTAKKNPLCNTR